MRRGIHMILVSLAFAALSLGFVGISLACPSAIKVGSPDFPNELPGDMLQSDPSLARMHLSNVTKVLPIAQRKCAEGSPSNCHLADFLRTAKSGLECYTGGGGSLEHGALSASNAGAAGSQKTANEQCECGPDYISCKERNCRREGVRCTVTRNGGQVSIAQYGRDGKHGGSATWYGGNRCAAITK